MSAMYVIEPALTEWAVTMGFVLKKTIQYESAPIYVKLYDRTVMI